MQEVYITNANFKKIVTSHEVAKDYKFSDIIVWNHGCGYCITEEESYVFAKWEARDLLMYKVFCIDIEKGATDFYKKMRFMIHGDALSQRKLLVIILTRIVWHFIRHIKKSLYLTK